MIYYQVALSVHDEKTLQRELRPLQAIRDHYPKMILTMDEEPEENAVPTSEDEKEDLENDSNL